MISLGLKNKMIVIDMLEKLFDKLGLGQIEEYVENEDIDSEDLAYHLMMIFQMILSSDDDEFGTMPKSSPDLEEKAPSKIDSKKLKRLPE